MDGRKTTAEKHNIKSKRNMKLEDMVEHRAEKAYRYHKEYREKLKKKRNKNDNNSSSNNCSGSDNM